MNLKDTENFKFLANFTTLILVVVGLVLHDYIWFAAALLIKSTTISIVIYHKDDPATGGFTPNSEDRMINELKKITLTRPKQKAKVNL